MTCQLQTDALQDLELMEELHGVAEQNQGEYGPRRAGVKPGRTTLGDTLFSHGLRHE